MRSRVVCMVGLVLAFLPGVARADEKEDCFNAAEKAQKLKNDKKLTEARPTLLTCSRDICPQQVRQDCVKWLAEVDNATSTIVVRARDSGGHDVIEVRVLVDGQVLLPKLQGTSVAVDPGQHKFRYEFPNGKVIEEDVLIAEGEKDRVLRAELKEGTTGGNVTPPPLTPETTPSHGGPGVAPWIIGGIGLASTLGFIIMEVPIQSQYSSLQTNCAKTPPQSCTQSDKDSLTSLYAPAGILLGVGIVGVGVGLTWLIVAAVTGHEPAKTTGSFGITPLAGGGFASFSRSF